MGRRFGYEEALAEVGIEFDERWVAAGPHGIEGGATAMAELMTRSPLPTAVLAEYDELAIGAIWALRRAGLRVPEDVSVVGIDNHEMAEYFGLTTVAQDVIAQGAEAARLLLELLDAAAAPAQPRHVLVATRLLLRSSTGLAPGLVDQPARSAEPDGHASDG